MHNVEEITSKQSEITKEKKRRLEDICLEGGFLGPMISDIRDNYINNICFTNLRKGYVRFVYNFCVRIRWNVHYISGFPLQK